MNHCFPQQAGFPLITGRIFTCGDIVVHRFNLVVSKGIEWENIFQNLNVHWKDGENLSDLSCSDISTSSPETNYSSVTP